MKQNKDENKGIVLTTSEINIKFNSIPRNYTGHNHEHQ